MATSPTSRSRSRRASSHRYSAAPTRRRAARTTSSGRHGGPGPSCLRPTRHVRRARPNCGVGTPIPGRPLSLPRLPQASWALFHAFAVFPQDAVTIDGETRDYAGRFVLSPLRLVHFSRTADEIEVNLGSLGAPDQPDANLRKLDRPSRVLVAAVSAHETIRPRSRRHGSL